MLMPLLLWGALPCVRGTCSSDPTCPLHSSDALQACSIQGSGAHYYEFSSGSPKKKDFPSQGLYRLAKVATDVSSCCFNVEIQGYFCKSLRGGVAVDGVSRITEIYVRVQALGTTIDVIISDEDTATVTHSGGTDTYQGGYNTMAGVNYGSPQTILTLSRTQEVGNRGSKWWWRLDFAGGGYAEFQGFGRPMSSLVFWQTGQKTGRSRL